MKKKLIVVCLALAMVIAMSSCGQKKTEKKTKVNVFAAASLTDVMAKFEKDYEKENPDVDIVVNADSSGTLMQQIQEGASCDIFFSAAQTQMDQLQSQDLIYNDSRKNMVNNQLVVITQRGSKTKVTGLENIGQAKSIALADGSVPVGKYTRQALINLGLLQPAADPSTITTEDVSNQLGGVTISEQSNVSKVLSAVEEGSCEVGTTYLSDTYGHKKSIKIIQKVSNDISGDIIYPVALTRNKDASKAETKAAKAFYKYITSSDAKKIYEKYGFDTDVK